ncbi:MAG TPA: guanylate kinase [Desulfitobacteriaceae bacterium]|jgi:guanylate kinase|nr:guanylate kinase [Desulfitobacteriaceae bacterium]
MKDNQGLLIVLSGPSGAGKGTLCLELLRRQKSVKFSVSCTTRAPRPGEIEGKSYFFRTHEEFGKMIKNDELLEWAEFCGNFYGTPRFAVKQFLEDGYDVILEIDIQGALQVKKHYPEGVFIFVAPPSISVLSQRIHERGTESEEVIQERLAKAGQEMSYLKEYDYLVVNDEISGGVDKLRSIIVAEKCRVKRNCRCFKGDILL